jgi:hypothetical protein
VVGIKIKANVIFGSLYIVAVMLSYLTLFSCEIILPMLRIRIRFFYKNVG